jgi:chromosome segregation ATPase
MTQPIEKAITFDTEGEEYEAVRIRVEELNKSLPIHSDIRYYLPELNKAWEFFHRTYNKNIKLLNRIQDASAQIVMHAGKIKAILDSTKSDRTTVSKLKKEYDEVSSMVIHGYSADKKSRELLTLFRQKVDVLSKQVQRGEAFSFGQDSSIFETSQDVTNLTKERNQASKEIHDFETQISTTRALNKQLSQDIQLLAGESERLAAALDESNVLFQQLSDANRADSQLVSSLRSEVRQQKIDLDAVAKLKAEHEKKKKGTTQTQYELVTYMGQLRDDSRALRDRLSRKSRFHGELASGIALRESRVESYQTKLAMADRELEACNRDLQNAQRKAEEYHTQFTELSAHTKKLSVQKLEARRVVRKLRNDLVERQFNMDKAENETRQQNRVITATKLSLQAERAEAVDAAFETREVIEQSLSLKGDGKTERTLLQKMKEKILSLLTEIDVKRGEKFAMDGKVQMTLEAIGIITEQNDKHLEVLDDFNQKNEDQAQMAEQLRRERNVAKRQFELVSAEVNAREKDVRELERDLKTLREVRLELLNKIVSTHSVNRIILTRIVMMRKEMEGQKNGILETERITSRLQAECQTLAHLWREAKHDRLQIDKERQVVEHNLKLARDELAKKNRSVEKLRGQIEVEHIFLRKCAFQYAERAVDVVGFARDLDNLTQKTSFLEEKRTRVLALEHHTQRLSLHLMFESQKYLALAREFSVPRNVHRWDVMETVNPTYVKHFRYYGLLTAKLDASHRQLIELTEERDKLREDLEKAKNRKRPLTTEQVRDYIAQYTEDIQEREKQIAELQKSVEGNQNDLRDSLKEVSAVRSQIVARNADAALLRTKSATAIREKSSGWFFTEVPVDTMRAGGFLALDPSSPVRKASEVSLRPTPIMTPDKRPQSMLNVAVGSKKVLTPVSLKRRFPPSPSLIQSP